MIKFLSNKAILNYLNNKITFVSLLVNLKEKPTIVFSVIILVDI